LNQLTHRLRFLGGRAECANDFCFPHPVQKWNYRARLMRQKAAAAMGVGG